MNQELYKACQDALVNAYPSSEERLKKALLEVTDILNDTHMNNENQYSKICNIFVKYSLPVLIVGGEHGSFKAYKINRSDYTTTMNIFEGGGDIRADITADNFSLDKKYAMVIWEHLPGDEALSDDTRNEMKQVLVNNPGICCYSNQSLINTESVLYENGVLLVFGKPLFEKLKTSANISDLKTNRTKQLSLYELHPREVIS